MNGFVKNETFDPYETGTNPMESTQNLTPGRFWHAEAESDVKTLQIRHPDLEMKENHHFFFFDPFTRLQQRAGETDTTKMIALMFSRSSLYMMVCTVRRPEHSPACGLAP